MRTQLPLVSAIDIIMPKLVEALIPLTVVLQNYSVTWIYRAVFLPSRLSAN